MHPNKIFLYSKMLFLITKPQIDLRPKNLLFQLFFIYLFVVSFIFIDHLVSLVLGVLSFKIQNLDLHTPPLLNT